jgi:hypothetical protein
VIRSAIVLNDYSSYYENYDDNLFKLNVNLYRKIKCQLLILLKHLY